MSDLAPGDLLLRVVRSAVPFVDLAHALVLITAVSSDSVCLYAYSDECHARLLKFSAQRGVAGERINLESET